MEHHLMLPSSSTSARTCDVFFNFRGEDTRYGFTGNLHQALCHRGIKTFMDDEELERGEPISPAIFKAIEGSRVAIIVFSKNYASSKWCLDELVKIMACLKAKELVVYPVFYCVDPSEVRNQTGIYGEQLAKQEEKMKDDKENVQNWRLALHEAANLAGWHFGNGYVYEHEFIKRIVDVVFSILKRSVGLEWRVSRILIRLHMSATDVSMVGICGACGIGKTTLARAVYDVIAPQFEGSCFLSDVKETYNKNGLAYLQEAILSDIVGEKIKLPNVHKGISTLIRNLHGKRILLILDGVDKLEQLKYLAGECDWFGCGSSIIITTRCKDILVAHGVQNIYDVPKLNKDEALQLLRSNASKRLKPDNRYDAVWKRAFGYSHGIPLVLKVIGLDLSEKPEDEWEIALERYEGVCCEDIQNIVKVSYDSLNECDKRIFLDIACFFTGEPLSYVEQILSACGLYPKYGISRLIDRSLMSISPNGWLEMHDHIIDMAVKIVQQESPLHPGKRSRLSIPEEVLQVLEEDEGTDKIEVMMLDDLPQGNEGVQLSDRAFKKMKNLRILMIKDAIYSGFPQHLPNSLRVLYWSGYPSCCLPPEFLNLPSNCLILNKFENMKCLNTMDFTDCKFLSEVPDVSGAPNLRALYLNNCENLVKIHGSVGFLAKLEELTATGCTNLQIIPVAFKSASLKVLTFSECSRLARFPEILCEIENLQFLNLWQTAIEELPSSIGNLKGLESLNLMECKRLEKLPSSIFNLPRLQEIQADSCGRFSISNECEDHGQMKLTVSASKIHLYLSCCNLTDEHLVTCLSGFVNVVHLDISYNNFTVLPACIKECIHSKTLILTNCKQLRDISVLPPKLEEIDALNCTSLTSQSSSVLLSQAFHETGHKIVILPGSRIPEWFDHCSSKRSITFWGRDRFPRICVCAVFGTLENVPYNFQVRFSIVINGHKMIVSRYTYSWSIVTDHVWLFDLSALIYYTGNLRGTFEKCDWNHVEVSCEDCQGEYSMAHVEHGPRRMAIVKWYGIYVYRQESKMEDILFTNVGIQQENSTSFENSCEDTYMATGDGAFHDTYNHIKRDGDLEISCYPWCKGCKRQRRK